MVARGLVSAASGAQALPTPVAGARLRALGSSRQGQRPLAGTDRAEQAPPLARAGNAASRRVMEKCGLAFQEEFTHKGALVAWYATDRADWQASQPVSRQPRPN